MDFKSFFTRQVPTTNFRGEPEVKLVPRTGRIVATALIVLIGLPFFFASLPFGIVNAGQRGVVIQGFMGSGRVTGAIKGEGLYFKLPLVQSVVKMDVQTQKEEVDAGAASKDLQTVNAKVALNYSVHADSVATIYQQVGKDYKGRIIDPAIQEAVKASTAKFTAEELITKREEVKEDIKMHLTQRLQPSGIEVREVNIVNFEFSASFDQAIEAKVTAEQNALAAKNKLAQVEYEAQQAVEKAKGEAEAIRINASAVSSNPQVLQLEWIKKWNGVQPQVVGASTPLIPLK